MKNASQLLSAFLILILYAAPHGASAQAATEYGLASGSSAASVSGVGKNLNHKLANTVSHSSATVHTVQPSGSKQRTVNSRSGATTTTNRLPKQAGAVVPPAAKGVPAGGFVVVGAEAASGSAPAAHPVGSSQSGLTVVGGEPR